MLCSEIEEKTKKVDREVLYLLNKLRSYPKPKPKAKKQADDTTTTSNNTKSSTNDTATESPIDDTPTIFEDGHDTGDKQPAGEETPNESSDPLGLLLPKLHTCVETDCYRTLTMLF